MLERLQQENPEVDYYKKPKKPKKEKVSDNFLGRCSHCLDNAYLDQVPCIDRFTGQEVSKDECLVKKNKTKKEKVPRQTMLDISSKPSHRDDWQIDWVTLLVMTVLLFVIFAGLSVIAKYIFG